jgi:E3 ubiquitin-protein ligase RFWD3
MMAADAVSDTVSDAFVRRLPHLPDAGCTSVAWAPGTMTAAASFRGRKPGQSDSYPETHVIMRAASAAEGVEGAVPDGAGRARPRPLLQRGDDSNRNPGGGGDGSRSYPHSFPFPRANVTRAAGHRNKDVMSRVALLRPHATRACSVFLAGASEPGYNAHTMTWMGPTVMVWNAATGRMRQALKSSLPASGGGITDVRGWSGGGGGGEVLACVNRDAMQLCTWTPGEAP